MWIEKANFTGEIPCCPCCPVSTLRERGGITSVDKRFGGIVYDGEGVPIDPETKLYHWQCKRCHAHYSIFKDRDGEWKHLRE